MSNILYIPEANPIHIVPVNPGQSSSYATKWYDLYIFEDTVRDFEEQDAFFAPWYKGDAIFLQMQGNFDPISIDVQNCDLDTVMTFNMTQVRANRYMPGFYIYEAAIDLSALDNGLYRLYITPGEDNTAAQKSEWLQLSEETENTVFCEYFHSRFKDDVVYETGIKFGFRFPGFINKVAPGSEDQAYKDQVLDQVLLSSKPFKNWKLFVGSGGGVPEWMIEKINRANSVDNVSYDGRLLAKPEGNKWTEAVEEKKRLVGYSCDLLDGLNRPSRIVSPTLNPNVKLVVQYNLDAGILGDTSGQAGENTVAINSFE